MGLHKWSLPHLGVYVCLRVVGYSSESDLSSPRRPACFRDKYLSNQPEPSPLDLYYYYGLSLDSRGMSLVPVERVLRG